MRNKFLTAAALAFALTLASCRNESALPFVLTDGTGLVTEDGVPFEIRGTNLGNWLNLEGYMFQFPKSASSSRTINDALCEAVGPEYMADFWRRFREDYITEDDVKFIASTGATVIRLPFHYKLFTGETYLGTSDPEEGFRLVDRVVDWSRRWGLRVILDMHDCPGGQTGDNIDDSYGYPWLFTDGASQEKFLDVWGRIARHYADEPVVLGYDLMNEPIAHYFPDRDSLNLRLQPLMKRAVAKVREYDARHIVILGGAQWNSNFKVYDDFTFDSNIVYSCHIYKCPPVKGSLGGFLRFREKSGRPMYMGETGENTDEWVKSFREALEKNGIGWTFWTYKRLDTGRSFVSIEKPEGWDDLVSFIDSDRSTFAALRENAPDRELCRKALEEYLEGCKFGNCRVNRSYIEALGLSSE